MRTINKEAAQKTALHIVKKNATYSAEMRLGKIHMLSIDTSAIKGNPMKNHRLSHFTYL